MSDNTRWILFAFLEDIEGDPHLADYLYQWLQKNDWKYHPAGDKKRRKR